MRRELTQSEATAEARRLAATLEGEEITSWMNGECCLTGPDGIWPDLKLSPDVRRHLVRELNDRAAREGL